MVSLQTVTLSKSFNGDDTKLNNSVAGLAELLELRTGADSAVEIKGGDAAYTGEFRLAETAASVIAAAATSVCDIWQLKTGRLQHATVDVRAAAAALDSYNYLQRCDENGRYTNWSASAAAMAAYRVTRPFLTRDQRWFLPHFGMLHLKAQMQQLLGCDDTVESVARAVSLWDATELEQAVADCGACGGIVRSTAEWLDHAQGRALANVPVIEIEKIGDSKPEPFRHNGPPLHGIRVLDLTRILAGPVAARTCAEQGADVLMVAAPHTPQIKNFVVDLSHGKRSTYLNLDDRADADSLRTLVAKSDVFSQGYRPGVLAQRGFGPHELAALRPGMIYLSTSCYGQHGPWAGRAGWEQVAQAVSGICHRVDPARPSLLPVNACDYLTGYLGACGILLALYRRAVEGGSYHVNVSLCQSALYLNRQPERSIDQPVRALDEGEIEAMRIGSDTAYGSLRHLAPVAAFSETKAQWRRPSPALGADLPQWLDVE